jgi:hypothetical protein
MLNADISGSSTVQTRNIFSRVGIDRPDLLKGSGRPSVDFLGENHSVTKIRSVHATADGD